MSRAPVAVMVRRARFVLRDNVVQHVAVDVGEAEVPAAVAIRELGVIDAHEMQHGRMDIVHVDRLFDPDMYK